MGAPRSSTRYKPPALERTIEQNFVQAMKVLGVKTKKLNGLGDRDWPDRLVLGPYGYFCLIEFKRPGGKLTPRQHALHWQLKQLGHEVQTFDDWKVARKFVTDQISALERTMNGDG